MVIKKTDKDALIKAVTCLKKEQEIIMPCDDIIDAASKPYRIVRPGSYLMAEKLVAELNNEK